YWQNHSGRRLVEPFCGGLAVTLGLRPARALLNDLNPHLINFYECLKQGLRIRSLRPEVAAQTMELRFEKGEVELPMENDERLFYAHRERFNKLLSNGGADNAEAAALFYYLNRTGFNGLCRFNRSGEF